MSIQSTPVLSFNGADISNGEQTVIFDVNMEVYPGELVYIIGKVGGGKTSLARTITAENALAGGSANVLGVNLVKIKRRAVPELRKKLGIVFQDFQLLMDRSVWDNLAFVLKSTGWKDNARIDNRIVEILELVGMESKAHKMPHQLSGGEKQRICIARALLNSPQLIIADEPTANLDSENTAIVMDLIGKILAGGTAVILITHRDSLLDKYPGRVFVCQNEQFTERLSRQ
ncbi:MAG: ATP-binding cassette domain-containing protein [Bacteroidales bacterium]|nr:ATP-binding cassette domain-containing protein [Bacteroidales bacterium]